jgi:hypothetical protein
MKRAIGVGCGLIVMAGIAVAANSSTDGNTRERAATPPCAVPVHKRRMLAQIGVTVGAYCQAKARAATERAAVRDSPPPDPAVVGPRLIREAFGDSLDAWQTRLARRAGPLSRRWTVHRFSEQRTVVTLVMTARDGVMSAGPARWALNFPLDRPLTPTEQHVADGRNGLVAVNAAARTLQMLPPIRAATSGPVELAAVAMLRPRHGRMIVAIVPRVALHPNLVRRFGYVDGNLVRGRRLLAKTSELAPLEVRLSPRLIVTREEYDGHRSRDARPATTGDLARSVLTRVTLLLRWPTASPTLKAQLARPVQAVELVVR